MLWTLCVHRDGQVNVEGPFDSSADQSERTDFLLGLDFSEVIELAGSYEFAGKAPYA